ncbi:hypothetical protein I5H08_gp066 [Mycobacterium phage Yuna]|uniref:Uncharacterized protein n=1 Tax=Mycobacterium phage Yuna TaxID=2599885 RepID=A0A5J6TEX5_9CAUD|nr:hypothetical protein I5H08_gp066 [Mycobacterium phage Yuna]QFG09421.1 hypothetical protein PBI_YUNA_39 [Mycobacterium phage Yuna]
MAARMSAEQSVREAIWAAIYNNTSPADQFDAVLAAVPGEGEVWVVDVSAEGPEGGDYDGWQFVHASREGAVGRLVEKLVEYGLGDVEPFGSATADDGSMAGEYEADGRSVSYGVHRMPVEP